MSVYTGPEKRRHFRLRYPTIDRPIILIEDSDYKVAEISEGGVVFLDDENFFLGQLVFGVMKFHDGRRVTVAGKVLRMKRREVVVELTKGVPSNIMMAEQRYVIARYTQTP